MKLSDIITLDCKFARSINLERDCSEIAFIDNYQITPKAKEVIERFVASLGDEKVSAWSLIGSYGMGKSAFLNYFLSITGPVDSEFTRKGLHKLKDYDKNLYTSFLEKKKSVTGENGFFHIFVVASFESVNVTLARGLYKAILQSELSSKKNLIKKIEVLLENSSIESVDLLDLFKEVIQVVKSPLVIIIDEFGKNLEYLSYHYYEGDLFILQQLAEIGNVYLWVALHQAFQEYMSGFSIIQQQEWNKVQGRFEEISFVESAVQMLCFIQAIVGLRETVDMKMAIENWAIGVKKSLESIDLVGKEYFSDPRAIEKLYPFHPITCLALVELCRKYAQNERTLTSFLCSGHEFALPAKLEKIKVNKGEGVSAIGLDSLYDYFFGLNTALVHTSKAQRWLEIQDIIQSSTQYSKKENTLLRCLGILNLLSGYQGLRATPQIIVSVMEFTHCWSPVETKKMLKDLAKRGIIFKRDYSNEYRLWEGSDFDVNRAVAKEKAKLSIGSLEKILEKHLVLSPVIAARHSHEKGVVRKFERRWVDSETLLNKQFVPLPGFDGLLLYCFGTAKKLKNNFAKVCTDNRPLMLIYAPVKEVLTELVSELVACKYVLDKSPQIAYDKVARKEVKFRYQLAKKRFREFSEKTFIPGTNGLMFYAGKKNGRLYNRRELSSEISSLCDEYYREAPVIGNEMISGEKLSGIAVWARRELVEAMTTNADQESLGFTGSGPEVAIYQSLIFSKGLHKQDLKTGKWYLTLKGNDPGILKMWESLEQFLSEKSNGATVKEMLNLLRRPPFGLRQGPILLYLSLYLLVKSEDLIVFCEDTYYPYLSAEDMALLLKRPELFTVKKFKVDQIHQKVFMTYKNIFKNTEINVDNNLRNSTMLGVVGPLMKFIGDLPGYSKQTCNVSKTAQSVRSVICNAVDPFQFLFEGLPTALGIKADKIYEEAQGQLLERNLREVLAELNNAFEGLSQNVKKVFLRKFNFSSLNELYNKQSRLASNLLPYCDSLELKPVLQAMTRREENLVVWLWGVAGAILKKPIDVWDDDDFNIFCVRLTDHINQIKQLAVLAEVSPHNSKAHIISVMQPGGNVWSEVVNKDIDDPKVQDLLKQIMSLPEDKSKAILAALAESIVIGEKGV